MINMSPSKQVSYEATMQNDDQINITFQEWSCAQNDPMSLSLYGHRDTQPGSAVNMLDFRPVPSSDKLGRVAIVA